jgi:hypothetical protein
LLISETTPVKTVQLDAKVIEITCANRGTYKIPPLHTNTYQLRNHIQTTPSHWHHRFIQRIGFRIADCCLFNNAAAIYSIDIGDKFASLSAKFPNKLFALQADVTGEDSNQAAIGQILETGSGLHGMMCNAGRTMHKAALDFRTE